MIRAVNPQCARDTSTSYGVDNDTNYNKVTRGADWGEVSRSEDTLEATERWCKSVRNKDTPRQTPALDPQRRPD